MENERAKTTINIRTFLALALVLGLGWCTPIHPSHAQSYTFSRLEGSDAELAQAYPLYERGDGFRVRYQPNSFAAQHLQELVGFIQTARAHINQKLGLRFQQPFEVYFANTFFQPPNHMLRGRAFSKDKRLFILLDGSGSPAERRYMIAHELTHVMAWNGYGRPKSAMLSEGVAVFAAEKFLRDTPGDSFLPLQTFCLAYQRAGALPRVSSTSLVFAGHLFSLDIYNASGCFVQHLFDEYGAKKFGQVYGTVAYGAVYGKTLGTLEQDWLRTLDKDKLVLPFAPARLPFAYAQVLDEYRNFFRLVETGTFKPAVYAAIDARRLNVLRGKV